MPIHLSPYALSINRPVTGGRPSENNKLTLETTVEVSFSESFIQAWTQTMGDLRSIEQYLLVDLQMGLEASNLKLPSDATVSCEVFTGPSWDDAYPATVEEVTEEDLSDLK